MSGPYFQPNWAAFIYQGVPYDLAHLNEYELTVNDTATCDRRIAVTFSDHCFTRNPAPGDDAGLLYPASDRKPGHFCFERYTQSLSLTAHIAKAVDGKVWTVREDAFAILPTVDQSGRGVFYTIMFSLDRATGLPVHLHMRIKTAYPAETPPVTHGDVRFRHLVALRMQRQSPGRITGQHRRVPRLG